VFDLATALGERSAESLGNDQFPRFFLSAKLLGLFAPCRCGDREISCQHIGFSTVLYYNELSMIQQKENSALARAEN
jgi:hypothetical protein